MFGIGTPELIFIFLVGFFIFGPRQLPEIGRRLGEIMGQLRRAADDFKQTWEAEVESERARLVKAMPSITVDLETPAPDQAETNILPAEGALPRTSVRPSPPPSPSPASDASEPPSGDEFRPEQSDPPPPAVEAAAALRLERSPAPSVEAVGYEG